MSKIILHIGYGKTGTTAVQGWLLRNRDKLAEQGIFECGTAMQNPALGTPLADRVPDLVQLIAADRAGTAARLAAQINTVAAEYDTVVWSSEFLLNQDAFVADLVGGIDPSHDIEIVIYLRNHVDWLLSAYAQWAIKHPAASRGDGVVSFDNFVAQRVNQLDYVTTLKTWSGIDGATLVARSYDLFDDIIDDFASLLGVDPDSLSAAPQKTNENLGRAQLALLKIVNQNTENEIHYRQFASMLSRAGAGGRDVLPTDPTPIPVGAERLRELQAGFENQRRELKKEFGVTLADAHKDNRYGEVAGSDETNTDLIAMLGMVCFDLFRRTAVLEREVRELRKKAGRGGAND